VAFIDAHRDDVVEGGQLGVELICRVLQVAPSTYYAAKNRVPSARACRDGELIPQLVALWEANYRVYGARKLWKAAGRAGLDIGRDQVARLMRAAGIEGARRTKRVRTTRADPVAARHPDLVERRFQADTPNQLWVTDLTYVPTWSAVAYVCFIVDAFSRMIVGWRVAPHMRTSMVLDALEMARWARGTCLDGLRCHSDAGSQFTSVRYGERLAELGAVPSIGSVGDSFELLPTPWKNVSSPRIRSVPAAVGAVAPSSARNGFRHPRRCARYRRQRRSAPERPTRGGPDRHGGLDRARWGETRTRVV
jgi:transposase InsO family protein